MTPASESAVALTMTMTRMTVLLLRGATVAPLTPTTNEPPWFRQASPGRYNRAMQYLLLVYIDPPLLEAAPPGEFETEMRQCLQHADDMTRQGSLLGFQQLEAPTTAKSVRVRAGQTRI